MKYKESAYSQLLRDPRWQKKRLEILQRDEWQCRYCRNKEKTLHVHHISYEWKNKPWDYEDSNFVTLCDGCHAFETAHLKEAKDSLKLAIEKSGINSIHAQCLSDSFKTAIINFDSLNWMNLSRCIMYLLENKDFTSNISMMILSGELPCA